MCFTGSKYRRYNLIKRKKEKEFYRSFCIKKRIKRSNTETEGILVANPPQTCFLPAMANFR